MAVPVVAPGGYRDDYPTVEDFGSEIGAPLELFEPTDVDDIIAEANRAGLLLFMVHHSSRLEANFAPEKVNILKRIMKGGEFRVVVIGWRLGPDPANIGAYELAKIGLTLEEIQFASICYRGGELLRDSSKDLAIIKRAVSAARPMAKRAVSGVNPVGAVVKPASAERSSLESRVAALERDLKELSHTVQLILEMANKS